jgi:hypothetical protein
VRLTTVAEVKNEWDCNYFLIFLRGVILDKDKDNFTICRLYSAKITVRTCIGGARGGVVVKALRYKPAGREFDSRWCHWNFSVP